MSLKHQGNSGWDFLQGHTKRNDEGAFRGAGGHFGLRSDPSQGVDGRVLGGYGEFGWEGAGGFNGFRAGGTALGINNDPGARGESGFWGGINGLDANAGIYDDGSTFSAGYNADWVNASAGYRTVDANSDHDRGLRAGVSLGVPSGGFRLHHGDADEDGRKEYGFGVDVPTPWGVGVSLDYTSETLPGDLASMALLGPGAMLMNWGMDAVGLGDYAPGTLMQNAGEWIADGGIGRTASAVGDGISDAAGWLGDTASSVGGGIADAASSVGGAISSGASAVGGAISSGASAAWSAVTSGW